MTFTTTELKPQWNPLGSKPVILSKDADLFIEQLDIKDYQIALKTEQLSNEAKMALRNISIYGTRLLLELNESLRNKVDFKKVREIESKIRGINQFLEAVLTQKDINNAESKQKKFKRLLKTERNDKNRGTGLYQVYASIKAKKYIDENGNEVAVKSTAGELVYDFMQALYPWINNRKKKQKINPQKRLSQTKNPLNHNPKRVPLYP